MNIKLYTANADFPNCHSLPPVSNRQKPAAGRETGNFDRVTINSPQYPADEASFARILACKTAQKLEKGVSQERVGELQQQVASGFYKPDARQIAEHMLGYR